MGKVGPNYVDLNSFFIGKLTTTRPVVDFDRFLTLLHQFSQQGDQVFVREQGPAMHLRFDIGIFNGCIDETQRLGAALIPSLHGAFQRGVDLIAQHGYGLSLRPLARDSR